MTYADVVFVRPPATEKPGLNYHVGSFGAKIFQTIARAFDITNNVVILLPNYIKYRLIPDFLLCAIGETKW